MMRCYIFDIDGTIANGTHRLHHIQKATKDWAAFFAACGSDAPIAHVVELARDIAAAGIPLVYVSGRSDECRLLTEEWLLRHQLPRGPLYMRRAGDYRADDILKTEMLDMLLVDGWKPAMAFDDRNRVVAAWRAAGVPCAQVAEGDF